jgi:capsular polysaccharide biosynthesis protein
VRYTSRFIVNPIVRHFSYRTAVRTWDEKMEGGYAVVTLLLSILAAVIIFSIFPSNLINILLGIILGLLISVAIYAKEKYDEF